VLAVMGTVRLVRRRPPLLTAVPAVFAAVLLLSALGPWSAPAVSRRDQTARLRAALREARVDPRRLPRDTVTVDSALYARINSGAAYLVEAHGTGALRNVVPSFPDSTRGTWRIAEHLGLRGGCRPSRPVFATVAWDGGVAGVAGGTVQQVSLHGADSIAVRMGGATLRLWLQGEGVGMDAGGWRASADLAPLRRKLETGVGCEREGRATFSAADALLPVRDASGTVRAQLLVTSIGLAPHPGAPRPAAPGLGSVDALVVLQP
jgi:hypothetical protein